MATSKSNTAVEIRPEVTMLSVLRHLNYKAWFALAEFIDNALQSFISNQVRLNNIHGPGFGLKVQIKIETSGPGLITITDNAAGICGADFPRAFRAAQVPTDRTGLSEFGMGMKSAACWFAETWSVRTKALGESVERTICFDVSDIVENKVESLEPVLLEVDPVSHYTVVSLRGLHHIPHGRTLGKIKDHLASIYRIFLRDGRLQLFLNGDKLSYTSPKILKAPIFNHLGTHRNGIDSGPVEWRKDINLDFGAGQRVKGFAALRETGSTTLAGFALFRRDRLIEGSFDETYRPSYIFKQTTSYPYQRLFGELHIEGFEVSHTKDGFRWEEYEDIFLDLLKDELEKEPLDLLAQAENYRALPSRSNIGSKAAAATNAVADYVEKEVQPLLIEARNNPSVADALPAKLQLSELQSSERSVELNDGNYLWIITLRTSVDPAVDDWLSVAKADKSAEFGEDIRRLEVSLSLAHPFSVNFLGANNENVELLLRISTAVCIALVLAEDVSGDPPESFLYHLNYLLRGALTSLTID